MAKTKKPDTILPGAGEAFAFPIGDGRFSVCRVILGSESEQAKRWKFKNKIVMIAGSSWIGVTVPSADEAGLRPILHLTHHAWADSPSERLSVVWTAHMPPPQFIPIGTIAPTAEEELIKCDSFSTWEFMATQALLQWRWDNEREAVLAEDAVEAQKAMDTRRREQKEREDYLNSVTLAQLRDHKFFSDWTYPSVDARSASQKIMAETVEGLLALGDNSSEADRLRILRECIESFNKLDARLAFIETEEREDICEEFQVVAYACGLGPQVQLADKWRTW